MKPSTRLGVALALAASMAACAAAPPAGRPTAAPTGGPTATIQTPPSSTQPAGDASAGTVVFSHAGDIYVMHADGTQRAQLTTDPATDFDPVWSPDGAWIAFRSHRDGNEEVYLMNADGTGQRNLSQAPGADYSPAWSPDGAWIAFQSNRAGTNSIWVIRPDGTDLHQVTDIPGISEYPSWSPDSARIAFQCTFGRVLPQGVGDFEICVVNADGTGLTQLTDAPGESKLPAWSPDGTRIAFQSNRHGWPTLPGYEPPGYEPDRFGEFDIYLIDADGSNPVNLTNNPREDEGEPAWSRDGLLLFGRYGCLIVSGADGAELAQLTPAAACDDHFPDWYQPAP